MAYVGIVLISHSPKVAEGIKDIIRQVMKEVPVETAGGTDDHEIGTSVEKIQAAIERADGGKGVLLFYDLGSAMMNAEVAVELSESEDVKVAVDLPLLEGSYVGAVESGMGKSLDEVLAAVKKAFK
ncbi:dihydroxyacetone kinase phosphoryl donor subunit DhaM [Aquibacillus sp. 3ASR75-11]|uniref:phosphoenolpyruvate--glycerone phosphotransferase n=1 Tax=Terrihalobacillus insolitus TaxID=2950438 RepID=A0A9X4AKT3_9BACI|nr:dihydroxyacetone kinase phosphoryl donor subunit DhaM [Terrihalobacillus insolitus]MDC3412148.1 dihydroxyacetone kinase phosphoryl donor subunit DhaM [Terrihalobacillus insolitus]MDC3423159.1 dihydroxyacetone kinase phosphoryl donor subunit DhaM [Terrihalobacillus insolitus]